MTPGPNIVLKTRLTGSLVKITTIGSGNTCGARFWTDGKREAPMLPDAPWLRVLPDNSELFWTDECEQVAQEGPWGTTADFADVPFADEPSIVDYDRALETGMATTPEKERYVRMRRWWVANDPVRSSAATAATDATHRANLLTLLSLLDDSVPDQRLMSAEIHRELGDFSSAAALLAFQFPKDYDPAVNFIRLLNEKKDASVREVA
jgi:hypothetical protein